MEKLKQLWGYALFRWVCLWLALLGGLYLCWVEVNARMDSTFAAVDTDGFFFWFDVRKLVEVAMVFMPPIVAAIWVWRRLFGRAILCLVRVVNKAAE
jgi:hypothetical protein